LDVNSAINK